MKIISTITLIFTFNILLYSQNFFPMKLGNRYQYKETYTYNSPFYSKYVITKDTLYEGIMFYKFDNQYLGYNSLENKLYILRNDGIDLAVDFNLPVDSSIISSFDGRTYVSKGTFYQNIFGKNRLCYEMQYFYSNNEPPWISQQGIEYVFADSIGLFKRHSYSYSIDNGGTDYSKELYALEIDSIQYSSFSFDINLISDIEDTPINYFPLKIKVGTSISDFNLVDTIYADFYVYRNDTLVCNKQFPFSKMDLTVNVDIDSSILKVSDLIKFRCVLKGNTVLENSYFSPDSGYYSFRVLTPSITGIENINQNPVFSFGVYPSPFNSSLKIVFQLPNQSLVNIDIYNILGKKVRSIINKELPAGNHSFIWNAQNDLGNVVPSGIYFVRLNSNNLSKIIKVVLLK